MFLQFKPPIQRKRKRNGTQVYRPPQKEPPPCGCVGKLFPSLVCVCVSYSLAIAIAVYVSMYTKHCLCWALADVSVLYVVAWSVWRNVSERTFKPQSSCQSAEKISLSIPVVCSVGAWTANNVKCLHSQCHSATLVPTLYTDPWDTDQSYCAHIV